MKGVTNKMIYAIVTTYTDGHRNTEYINQKAATANKGDSRLIGFISNNHLYAEYVAEINTKNEAHPIKRGIIAIDIVNAKTVQVFNVDSVNGRYVLNSLISTAYKR